MKKRYDSYKPSGIDWIGDIPSHWEIQRLKFGMNLINGRAYLQPELLSKGKYRILRVGNFFTNDSWYYSDMELEDNKYCSKGDLLYAWSASIGPYIWNEEKVIFHYHIWKVGLSGKMDKKYSFYLLDVITKVKLNDMHGSAMQHLTMENMNNSDIIVPPLAEQEAIAAWLDEKCEDIDAAIAKVDREIELIDELKQSEISRVVTRGLNPDAPLCPSGIDWIGDIPKHWIICKVKHLVKFNSGDTITSEQFIDNAEFPVYGANGYRGQFDKYNFENQRILIGRVGALCGNVHYTNEKIWCSEHALISSKAFGGLSFDYKWMCLLFESMNLNQYGGGSAQPVIASSVIENLSIILPPLSEQQAIADYLDKKCTEIDGLKAKSSKKRETLKELRQSIISEVVTGKRKVI